MQKRGIMGILYENVSFGRIRGHEYVNDMYFSGLANFKTGTRPRQLPSTQ